MASTRRWRPGTGLVMVLTAWLLATPQVEAQPFAANELAIVHINVGQGDAPLILGPADANGDRIAVLMDAGDINGPDGGILVGAVLAQYGVTRLDVFIASHYDADHIGGIVTGQAIHGSSFILGPNGEPGAIGDDDGDGDDGWLDNVRTIPARTSWGWMTTSRSPSLSIGATCRRQQPSR